jgi:hypothetical protein
MASAEDDHMEKGFACRRWYGWTICSGAPATVYVDFRKLIVEPLANHHASLRSLAELTGVQAAALVYDRTIWVAAAFLLAL